MRKLVLTFDVEDFINSNEITAIYSVLEILAKYDFKALFFITGHVAEKLANYPALLDLLETHEIGFHSSGHSVRPTIPEYTDVEDYKQAYVISLKRETAHINPLTGEPEGRGGIYSLKDLFNSKKIEAFRAPGMSWTPPNLEALNHLGIKFDFSSNITSSEPRNYKGITFYPYTFIQKWDGVVSDYQCLLSALLRREIAILDLHPTLYVNQYEWDSIYYEGNPTSLYGIPKRLPIETASLFKGFNLLMKRIDSLQKAKLITVNPSLTDSATDLKMSKYDVTKTYEWSMRWPKQRFHYNPKFVRTHFYDFFRDAYS